VELGAGCEQPGASWLFKSIWQYRSLAIVLHVEHDPGRYHGLSEEDRQIRLYGDGNVAVVTARQRLDLPGR
jgi:hypothetical protein